VSHAWIMALGCVSAWFTEEICAEFLHCANRRVNSDPRGVAKSGLAVLVVTQRERA